MNTFSPNAIGTRESFTGRNNATWKSLFAQVSGKASGYTISRGSIFHFGKQIDIISSGWFPIPAHSFGDCWWMLWQIGLFQWKKKFPRWFSQEMESSSEGDFMRDWMSAAVWKLSCDFAWWSTTARSFYASEENLRLGIYRKGPGYGKWRHFGSRE